MEREREKTENMQALPSNDIIINWAYKRTLWKIDGQRELHACDIRVNVRNCMKRWTAVELTDG